MSSKKYYDIVIFGTSYEALLTANLASSYNLSTLLIVTDNPYQGKIASVQALHRLQEMARLVSSIKTHRDIFLQETFELYDYSYIRKYIDYGVENKIDSLFDPENFKHKNIDISDDFFAFVNRKTLRNKKGRVIKFNKCLIAAEPHISNPPSFSNNFLLPNNFWEAKKEPKDLILINPSLSTIPIAIALASINTRVRILCSSNKLAPDCDDIVNIYLIKLIKDSRARIEFNVKIKSIDYIEQQIQIVYTQKNEEHTTKCREILHDGITSHNNKFASFKKLKLKLNKNKQVVTDSSGRTSSKNIYYLNSVLYPQASKQIVDNNTLIHNIFLDNAPIIRNLVPITIIPTDPNICTFGLSESKIIQSDILYEKIEMNYKSLIHSNFLDDEGEITLFADQESRILGGIVIGKNSIEITEKFSTYLVKQQSIESYISNQNQLLSYNHIATIALSNLSAKVNTHNSKIQKILKKNGFEIHETY